MDHISAPELAGWLNDPARPAPQLIDVREPWEFDTCHITSATPLPMRDSPARLAEIDPGRAVVCICHHGMRSLQVANFLHNKGYANLYNLTGGMHAWAVQVDPGMATY